MAFLWQNSFVPNIDPNGNPYVGAQAFFYAAGTTTPKAVYWDSAFDAAHDHPVLSDGAGRFPAVFIPEGDFRVRVLDAGGATLWEADGISVPSADNGGGGGGGTPTELLARTGDVKFRYATGAHSGWVRANGRTIGSAVSGATERANADCEDLFTHLWGADANLVVSGGRGANAASDWSAGKTITLPSLRNRAVFGLGDMGSTNAALIADTLIDGAGTNITLGATGGEDEVTLTIAQTPKHTHTGTTSNNGAHTHTVDGTVLGVNPDVATWREGGSGSRTGTTSSAGAHEHTVNLSNVGGDEAHTNMPPFILMTGYLKL